MTDASPPRRRPAAGAALPHPDVSTAIRDACVAELTERGINAMSMDSVAKRAGVGKAALYRRFSGKGAMVVSVVGDITETLLSHDSTLPFGGDSSLADDLHTYLGSIRRWLDDPRIITDLLAAGQHDPELLSALQAAVTTTRAPVVEAFLAASLARGDGISRSRLRMMLDTATAAVFWRNAAGVLPIDAEWRDELVNMLVAGSG